MKLNVNGELIDSEANTLNELLHAYDFIGSSDDGGEAKGVAVAVNDAVVPKQQWQAYSLQENDRIEIVRAIRGG